MYTVSVKIQQYHIIMCLAAYSVSIYIVGELYNLNYAWSKILRSTVLFCGFVDPENKFVSIQCSACYACMGCRLCQNIDDKTQGFG